MCEKKIFFLVGIYYFGSKAVCGNMLFENPFPSVSKSIAFHSPVCRAVRIHT